MNYLCVIAVSAKWRECESTEKILRSRKIQGISLRILVSCLSIDQTESLYKVFTLLHLQSGRLGHVLNCTSHQDEEHRTLEISLYYAGGD